MVGTPGPSGAPSAGQAQQRGFGVVVVVGLGVVVAPSAVGMPAEKWEGHVRHPCYARRACVISKDAV